MNKIKNILLINSYAGSLVIAAKQEKMKILGSYEDTGHGIDIQKLNFPKLDFIDKYEDWPAQDLSKTIVLAHPPCAAFSNQNNNESRKGIDTDAFKCTKQVLKYAMENRCMAVAVESVPGAKKGAWNIHDEFADKYGYHVYRLDQNSIEFNVAQWRPRFWVLFIKKTLNKSGRLKVNHVPQTRTIQNVVDATTSKDLDGMYPVIEQMLKKEFTEEIRIIRTATEYPLSVLRRFVSKVTKIKSINAMIMLSKYFDLGATEDVRKKFYNSRFLVTGVRFLSPRGFATTILKESKFSVNGRMLCLAEYCDIMGFPRDYKWPENYQKRFRQFLSQGVCPPVAQWIIQITKANIERPFTKRYTDIVFHKEELIYKPKKKDYEVNND